MDRYNGRKQFPISPMKVKFTQDSIAMCFQNEDQVNQTCEKIAKGELTVDVFPPIRVLPLNGEMFSVDNRRLYVFRVLNLLGLLQSIVVRRVQRFDRQITTENEGCHVRVRRRRDNNQRWQKVETFRHCFCEEGKAKRLPTWWIKNLNHRSLENQLFYHKPNVPMLSYDYSPTHAVKGNGKDIHSRFDEENWPNNVVRSADCGEDNNAYSNTGEERNLSLVVTETDKASYDKTKSDSPQVTGVITVKPLNPFLDEVSISQSSRSTTPERPMNSLDKSSHRKPSLPRTSRLESNRLPKSLPSTDNQHPITFDKVSTNFNEDSVSFQKNKSFWESAIDQSKVSDEQLKAETVTEDFSEENKCKDVRESKLGDLQLKENNDLEIVTSQPESACAPDSEQGVRPEIAVRPPSSNLTQYENSNERQQDDKVATDQECCLTPCCGRFYQLMIPCLKLCQK